MANTTMALLTGGSTQDSNLFNEGDVRNIIVDGVLAADTAPGEFVFNDIATGTWIALDSDTSAAHKLAGPGQVGCVLYRRRITPSTGAICLNTADYVITVHKMAPICISGIVGGNIVDNSASASAGCDMTSSSTAFNLQIQALEATGATSGTAVRLNPVATLAANIITADRYAAVALGACRGSIWGGINE